VKMIYKFLIVNKMKIKNLFLSMFSLMFSQTSKLFALSFCVFLLNACSAQDEMKLDASDDFNLSADVAIKSVTLLDELPESEIIWGIRPISMQLTATDYMLDFRYRVLNAKKAAAIINRKTKPYLIVEKTGVKLNVPSSYKVGPLRQSAQFAQENRNYFMLFANPGRKVRAGDKVTIMAGDFRLEHLIVQ